MENNNIEILKAIINGDMGKAREILEDQRIEDMRQKLNKEIVTNEEMNKWNALYKGTNYEIIQCSKCKKKSMKTYSDIYSCDSCKKLFKNCLKIDIYMTQKGIDNGELQVFRPNKMSDEEYEKNCYISEMYDNDYDIAQIKKSNIIYQIATTNNNFNIFLWKIEDGNCIDCRPVSTDIENCKDISDIVNYLLKLFN